MSFENLAGTVYLFLKTSTKHASSNLMAGLDAFSEEDRVMCNIVMRMGTANLEYLLTHLTNEGKP
jgi:hypothetical protein